MDGEYDLNNEVTLTDLQAGVFEIRINRTQRMNALGVQTVKDLSLAVQQASNRQARVLLIRGSEQVFCAGADLKERKGMTQQEKVEHNAAINEVFNVIAKLPFVTIAVINGLALGGGLELAMTCDFRFAAQRVKIGLTESRIGVFPGAGGTQRLPRLIGKARALEMMLSAEPIESEFAYSIGLVNAVFASVELDDRVHAYAQLLASRSPNAQAQIKRLVNDGLDLPLSEALALERQALPAILESPDYAEGLLAFEEKRPPRFAALRQQ
jgi:enoyl-CoA hydratase/carnithine racemase